ncbi:MAG TPA: hypothetical protein VFC85_00415 [Verrucomicrobiae bacterium]|nr:hypothetical protein [Verrucomicrobiae bacterium]
MKKMFATLAIAGSFTFAAATCSANTIIEKFSTDPALDGWQVFGDTNLFQWDSANQNLAVTWDSSQTNSYFYKPLGRTFTKADSFCVAFDLNLADASAVGYFQLAVGLCNFAEATSTNFSRANFVSPDLFEFDYFPDGPDSYGPSIDATLIDSTNNLYFAFDDTKPMLTNTTYRVVLIHRAGESAISGEVFTNGRPFTKFPVADNYGAGDFNLDTFAIMNYTTLDDTYGDLLLAHGTVDNLTFASPLPVGAIQATTPGTVQFASDTNWLYTLQRTADFQAWTNVSSATSGNGTNLLLQDPNPPSDKSFYRVEADLP